MSEGKILREAADSISVDALDQALSRAFGASQDEIAPNDDQSGEIIGRYKLVERIGEGGFGVVYMAQRHGSIDRGVALKIIKPGMDSRQVVARFEAERQALAMMDHEHIASVFDSGTTDGGRPYFVMELVRGVAITDYCDRYNLDVRARLELFISVCHAVQHAHQKGIIHRDLKPANILVTQRDGAAVPKVIDFGIAKATHTPLTEQTVFTRFGQLMGTPAYMSPEQVEMGELDVDTRSDIYSLGVLLYELLTGSTPIEQDRFKHASHADLQRMICREEPRKPTTRLQSREDIDDVCARRSSDGRRLRETLRGDLDWIAMKSLEKSPTRRYETASALAADVSRYLNSEPVTASPPSTAYRLRKFVTKHRGLVTAVSIVAALLIGGTIISTGLAVRATRAERRANYNEGLANQRLHEEQKQRGLAERLGVDLTNQLVETDRAAERGRQLLYLAHMNLIQRQLSTGNDERILELLNHHRPAAGQRDLRGFEWYYAWRFCHRSPWTWRHHVTIRSVAHSRDGKIVFTGCTDGSVQAWDAQTGHIVSSARGHEYAVGQIVISNDGQTLFTGSDDQTVRQWSFESDRLAVSGPALKHAAPIRCLAVSADGERLASGSGDSDGPGALTIWDLTRGDPRTVDRSVESMLALAFSPDGQRLASGDVSGNVHTWNVETAALLETVETGPHTIRAMEFSPQGDTLAMGDARGVVAIWSSTGGRRRLGAHTGGVTDLAFSADGRTIASCAGDALVIVWDVERGERADVLRGHRRWTNCVSFSPTGDTVVSAGADDTAKTWSLIHSQAVLDLAAHGGPVTSVAFSPAQAHTLASAGQDGSVRLWNVDLGQEVATLPSYGWPVRALAFSPDGQTVVYGGGRSDSPANLIFWDIEQQQVRPTAYDHPGAVLAVAFSPDGNLVAAGDNEGSIALWDATTATLKRELANLTQAVTALAFSPDGEFLAASSYHSDDVTLFRVSDPSDQFDLKGHRERVTALAFSPDGRMLASGSIDQSVRIWDVADRSEQRRLLGHTRRILSLAFSPDGATLASHGLDDELRLWDMATGQEKLVLPCQPETDGVSVAFSADGRTLATVNDRSVVLHRATPEEDLYFHDAPEIPQHRQPAAGQVADTTELVLKAGPFLHRHDDVAHVASHWQVRSSEGSYSNPIINRIGVSDLTKLSVVRGTLLPGTNYYWRVSYVGANHVKSPFSSETSFTTDDFAMQVTPFDLAPYFNRDIVKNPGDPETDSVDTSPGTHLIVDGFDGTRSDNPRADGLPVDGNIGIHALGDYSGDNALQIGPNTGMPIRCSVPQGKYHFVRFLVIGTNGNSDMPVRFHYADGTTQRGTIRCDDWYHDIPENRYGKLRAGLLPIVNEMDRFYENRFRDENEAALFEVTVEVDPTKQMTAFVLETDAADVQYADTSRAPNHSRVRFNLMAATGVTVGP